MLEVKKIMLYKYGGEVNDDTIIKEADRLEKISRRAEKWGFGFISFGVSLLLFGTFVILTKQGVLDKNIIVYPILVSITILSLFMFILSMFNWIISDKKRIEQTEKVAILVFINDIKKGDYEKAEYYRRKLL